MKRILTAFMLLLAIRSYSQFANNWILGNGYGLNFSGTNPALLGGAITGHPDNSSSISDASGNLLFYSTGVNVWNKNHTVMPNGTGLIGSYTGGQCALIVPIPCNPNKYVIFHTTAFSNPGYLSYSVVDMNLNGGLGDVVSSQKNISLGSGWTEKLCAYYNPSTNNYWVLTHKWNSDQFVAFKVDVSSIATTSVVSSIGSIHSCGTFGGVHDAMGQLTISPDGTKIINALTCQDKYELFNFNCNTGIVSNSIAIPGNGGNAWGTAFSPDSKKIYTNVIFGGAVYQYDITVYNSSSVNASKTLAYNGASSGYVFGYMELGPDGKIYMPQPNTNFMSVINSPNLIGSASGFTLNSFSTGTAIAQWGISRIAYNIPTSTTVTPTFSLTVFSNSATCNGAANGSTAVFASPSGSYTYSWAPGTNTNSVNTNLAAGNYTVTVSNGGCGSLTQTVAVMQPSPISIFIDPLAICLGNPGVINPIVTGGTPAFTYTWSNGTNSLGTIVSPTTTTNYTLSVTDGNGCVSSAVTTVTVNICTGIHELNNNINIKLFPNPSSSEFQILSSINYSSYLIVNILGEKIKTGINVGESISISSLSNGIYFIQLFDKNKLIGTEKLIKN